MPTYDFTRLLIEGCISRTLHQMKQDGRRSLRNLIDLGLHFTKGQHQRHFLEEAQGILENEQSAYYSLLEQTIHQVRPEHLKTFGVNLGYEGLTCGARIIRRTRASDDGYCVPWCLILSCGEKGLDFSAAAELVRQGMKEGIYVYFLFSCGVRTEELQEFLAQFPLCAFVFLTNGEELLSQPLEAISDCTNIYFSIRADETGLRAAEALRAEGMLYGIHLSYRSEECLAPERLDAYLDYHPSTVLLLPDGPECFSLSETVYTQVVANRMAQQQPFILVEVLNDLLYVNGIISGEGSHVLFIEKDGSVFSLEEDRALLQAGNVLQDSLLQILRGTGRAGRR